jgi:prepilin-type N-terminal cleavage/methylation domain-containing protein
VRERRDPALKTALASPLLISSIVVSRRQFVSNQRSRFNRLLLVLTPREQTERQNTMQNKQTRRQGFTLVEIMIVVAIIGLLAAIAIPNFANARANSQAKACINNMRQIDGAVQQYALENGKKTTDAAPAWTAVSTYIKLNNQGKVPGCPLGSAAADGDQLTIGTIGAVPQVTCANNALTPAHKMP